MEEIFITVGKKYNLPSEVVKAIFESQFQCAREQCMNGQREDFSTFKNIRFQHLGLLYASPYKHKKLNESDSNITR